MEDVVLHFQSGSADVLSSLLKRTEKLLEPFSCRTPQVFSPWFPSTATDCHRPIRPARPAPIITSAEPRTRAGSETVPAPRTRDGSETVSEHRSRTRAGSEIVPEPRTRARFCTSQTAPPLRRSWSVFIQRGVLPSSSESPSKRFSHMTSLHGLHPRQRVKWVIGDQNCRNLEKVWSALSRSTQTSRLPTCNANLQQELAQIWVFCDLLYSEQVGCYLKEELQLSGIIRLEVPRLGAVYSM